MQQLAEAARLTSLMVFLGAECQHSACSRLLSPAVLSSAASWKFYLLHALCCVVPLRRRMRKTPQTLTMSPAVTMQRRWLTRADRSRWEAVHPIDLWEALGGLESSMNSRGCKDHFRLRGLFTGSKLMCATFQTAAALCRAIVPR
eukprot:1161696-Pelagomonas_calceolata.AAC.10